MTSGGAALEPQDLPERGRMSRPLRVRDFRLLWTGQTISMLGDGVTSVALSWQALTISPHATSVALVLFARMLPRSALLLLGGVISDRFSRRMLMLVSDAVQAIALGALAVLTGTGHVRLWELAAFGAVSGMASAFFLPASTALLPDIVSDHLLMPANALNSMSHLTAEHFAGPALGGVLVATVGTAWAFGVDALSFAVSVATLAGLRVRSESAPSGSMIDEVRAGIRYVGSERWLWVSLLTFGIGNFLIDGPFSVLMPVLIRNQLHAGPGGFGMVLAAFGVGGLVSVVIAGRIGSPRRPMMVIYGTFAVGNTLVVGLGMARSLIGLSAVALAAGVLFEFGNLAWTTLMQIRVPRAMLGRVSSLDWFVSVSLIPISVALAGPIAVGVGAPAVFIGGGLLAAATDVTGYLVPGVRAPDHAAPTAEPAT